MTGPLSLSTEERFWNKVSRSDSCWLWAGAILKNGYGYAWDGQRARLAHRFAYELKKGLIPDGLVIDHLCRVPACVNPDHLEAVTQMENVWRGEGPRVQRERRLGQTHCKRGNHPLAGDNLYVDKRGRRACRECARVGDRDRKRAKRAAQKVSV